MAKNIERITKKYYIDTINEINRIKRTVLPDTAKKINQVSRHGDSSENAELQAELKYKKEVESNLRKLENIIRTSEVVDSSDIIDKDRVQFSCKVTLQDIHNETTINYYIVGMHEAKILENKIYYKSTIAKCMIGKTINDEVTIIDKRYKIIEIEY